MKRNITLTLILAVFSSVFACAQSSPYSLPSQVRLSVVARAKASQTTPVATTPITDQPEGDLLPGLEWRSKACYVESGTLAWKDRGGLVAEVVRNGSEIYLHNPVSMLAGTVDCWVKGSLSSDGSVVTIPTPQAYVLNNPGTAQETMLYATRINATNGSVESDKMDLTFSYGDEGLTQTDGGLLAITDLEGNFYGYGDMNIQLRTITDKVTTLPKDLVPQSYTLSYEAQGIQSKQTAQVAIDGNEVYISNPLGSGISWLKATLNGKSLSLPTKQYLGAEGGYLFYLCAAKDSTYIVSNPVTGNQTVSTYRLVNKPFIQFEYDPTAKTFHSSDLMIVNAGHQRLGDAYIAYDKPAYEPWTMVAATPATPQINSYLDLSPYAAYGLSGAIVTFTVPAVDVNNNFIAQENLDYQVSFDGQPKELFGVVHIPYYYTGSDGSSVLQGSGNNRQLQVVTAPTDSISIQSFYVVNGETRASDIITYLISDGTTHTTSGISTVRQSVPQSSVSATWYDLGGRVVSVPSSHGVYVCKMKYADGKVIVKKVMR